MSKESWAILTIVMGFLGTVLGYACWVGWYPTRRKTGWFKDGVHADLLIMGPGLVILGEAGLNHSPAVGLLGLAIVIAGFVLGIVSPPWMFPRWYKERYPDSQPPK